MAEKKVQRSITISPSVLSKLEKIARREDRSVSNLIERQCEAYIREQAALTRAPSVV